MDIKDLFEHVRTDKKTRDDGSIVTIETYVPKPDYDIYVDAIDLETGLLRKCRVTALTKHIGIKMYRIYVPKIKDLFESANDPIFETFVDLMPMFKKQKRRNMTIAQLFGLEDFEEFYASSDHSLIVYDRVEDKIKLMTPEQLRQEVKPIFNYDQLFGETDEQMSDNEGTEQVSNSKTFYDFVSEFISNLVAGIDTNQFRYFLIKKRKYYQPPYYSPMNEAIKKQKQNKQTETEENNSERNNRHIGLTLKTTCDLVPVDLIHIQKSTKYDYGYDLTVEPFKTFALANGIFVMDTMVCYSVLYTQTNAELGKVEYHYVMPRYSLEPAWPILYDSLLGWYMLDVQEQQITEVNS